MRSRIRGDARNSGLLCAGRRGSVSLAVAGETATGMELLGITATRASRLLFDICAASTIGGMGSRPR